MDQEIHDNDQEETPPLLNPLILLKVFHYLDHSSLKEARLVCPLWNSEAAPILTKRSQIILKSPYQQWWDDSYLDHPENRYDEYDKLNDTLIHSSNPAVFFQNALLDFALLKNSKFLQMLQEYGHLLMSVEVKNCNFQASYSFLVGNEGRWVRGTEDSEELRKYLHPILALHCKNLAHLKVEAILYNYYDDDIISQSSLKITEPLALESVDIIGWDRQGTSTPPELKCLLDVIKASPKLKRLNFTAASRFVQALEFCEGVSTLDTVKNFEEFGWRFALGFRHDDDKQENIIEMFQIISKMEMKELRVLSLCNLTLYSTEMMAELVEFFQKNGKNLKKLLLPDVCINLDGKMKNVEPVFSTPKFQEILRFCPSTNFISVTTAKHWADLMIDLTSLKLKPYPNLTKLVLGGYILKNIESFQAIVGWFPNLVCLNLDGVRFSYAVYDGTRAVEVHIADVVVDIVDVVKTLGSLEKLQEFVLKVDFDHIPKCSPENLLAQIIEAAHWAPVLKILTIIDDNNLGLWEYFKMDDVKDALLQTKGFNCVQFEDFRMIKEEKLNIDIFISENHLPAKFVYKSSESFDE